MKKRQDAKGKILGAAIHEFSRHGFERAISYIASKAHVNDITIYRHFKHKFGLQLAALLEAQSHNPMITYMESLLAQDRVPDMSTVIGELGKLACGPGRDLNAMLYFAGLQNRKLLLAWENSPVRNRLMTPLSKYVRRLQEQGAVRRLDPDVLARAIMGSMLSLFSRNCVFSEMAIADPDSAETASLVAILERRTRHL